VIEGHRDTDFEILRGAKQGDHLTIEATDGSTMRFVVTDVRVVDTRKARISLYAQIAQLTLVTCYPFAVNPGGRFRWLVGDC
jgi:sortase A